MIKKRPLLKRRFVFLATVSIALVILFALEITNTTHIFHKGRQPKPVTAGPNTKGELSQSSQGGQPPNTKPSNTVAGDNKSAVGGTNSTLVLLEPSGNFVSNHRPNMGGSPAPNQMSSTCNTTPGATCQISFSKNGVTKSLPAQTTDRGGATYWSWKLQDIGLTEGTWQVKATASLNGQVKTVIDATNLEVSP